MECTSPKLMYQRADSGEFMTYQDARVEYSREVLQECGQCLACRLNKAGEWALRCEHEAKLHAQNCWVTLTYEDEHLPATLYEWRRDLVLFFKRLRKHFRPQRVRYFGCGEHGDLTARPHFHICLFGVDFEDRVPKARTGSGELSYSSAVLSRLWPYGWATVCDLTRKNASYTARYTVKKLTGLSSAQARAGLVDSFVHSTGELRSLPESMLFVSTRPGIGAGWFDRFFSDVCIGLRERGGGRVRTPGYYWKLLKRADEGLYSEIKAEHEMRLRPDWNGEQSEARLAVKAEVLAARVRNLKRERV